MPNVLKFFRSRAYPQEPHPDKKLAVKKGPATVFRRKDSAFRKASSSSSPTKLQINPSNDHPSISQNLTWTISQDDADIASTCNTDGMSIDLQAAVPDVDEPLDQSPKEENQLFTFTGKEVMENQLNHIRALHKLETEVAEIKYYMGELAKRHAAEIAKKDDEYVELLIKVRQTEQQLNNINGELGDVKEELGVVVATLMQFQHKHYEATHKHDNGFWSSFSYF